MKVISRATGVRALRTARLTLAFGALLCLCAAVAEAETEQQGNVRVEVSGNLSPRALPRTGTAPVAVSVAGSISTVDGSTPPQLKQLQIEINRHGQLDYQGLPTCRIGQIQPGSNSHALHACGSSLVGKGSFKGTISLPGQAPYPIEGHLLLFNGREGHHQVLLGHIYSLHPFATSFVITFDISSQRHGNFGTTLTANLGKVLGNKRNLTSLEMRLSRRFSAGGQTHSYISAGCPAQKGVPFAPYQLARTSFTFATGQKIASTLERVCRVRG